jgi:hypothetical protein
MKLKAEHLRHPFRTLAKAKVRAKTYFDVKLFPYRSRLRFRGDPRYQLQNVTLGFESRIDNSSDDRELLQRICAAYIKAVEHQETAGETYRPTKWWQEQQTRLQPVMQALKKRDIPALKHMYENFFRDPCSTGLLPMTGMPWADRRGKFKDIHRHFYLGHLLCSIDYWKERTGGRFAIADLAGTNIGNPFGIMVDGTLIRLEAPYQHYCAYRLSTLLKAGPASVVEIGGGFGGMAYFLLRDRQPLSYLDFDLPETIALASYFLMKAFPSLAFLLYGEEPMTPEAIARANVVLMPLFEIERMQQRSVDVAFSSFAISALPPAFMAHYLETIGDITQGYFLYIGAEFGAKAVSELGSQKRFMRMVESCVSGWNGHKSTNWNDVEAVYRIDQGQFAA